MADLSKITLPDSTTYNLKDANALANIEWASGGLKWTNRSGESTTISKVLKSKTFTGIYATGTTQALSNFYFGSTVVDSYTTPWHIKLKIVVTVPNNTNYCQIIYYEAYGYRSVVMHEHRVVNNSTSYLPVYYAAVYVATEAGSTTAGHALGVGLRGSTNYNNSSYARQFVIEVVEEDNCTFSFYDTADIYANIANTGSTNYSGVNEAYVAATGLQETGDSDRYDRIRFQQAVKAASAISSANVLVGDASGMHHLKTGGSFDITYPILYSQQAVSSGSTTTQTYIIFPMNMQTTQSITLTAHKPVYIKGTLVGTIFTPISSTPLTQDVPTTEDGYQYIFLGQAYSTTSVYLMPEHKVYQYVNGAFSIYGASSAPAQVNALINSTLWSDETTTSPNGLTAYSYSIDLSDSGFKSSSIPLISQDSFVTSVTNERAVFNTIAEVAYSDTTLTIYAETKPEINFYMRITNN